MDPTVNTLSNEHFVLRRVGTDAKYKVDQTQSTRLSSLVNEELMKESKDDVFEAGDEMDEDIHHIDEE
ncbi:hypothetical protein Tco_1029814 [Tanacetum coccineum]|uniref:Uncharacterized protein n=1 Tax=Tanacetum coccineum TaxID=301880 RepID=A0ABQ5G4H7_9ASTR